MATSKGTSLRYSPPLLDRYIVRQLIVALCALSGGAVALIWLIQSLHFIPVIVQHGLSLTVFIELTGLLLPNLLTVILPISTFLVILFAYQRMAQDRELTVMKAAGRSPLELARPGIFCASAVVLISFALTLWLVPASDYAFRKKQMAITNRVAALLIEEGVFTSVGNNLTVYVRSRDAGGQLQGVLIEDDRDPKTHATILAESGAVIMVNDLPRVVLYNGSRQQIDSKTGRLNVLTFGRNTIELAAAKKSTHLDRTAEERSLFQLLHSHGQPEHTKFLAEATHRLTTPFSVFSYAMIALVAVLRGAFSRHGNITRPLTAIFTVVGLLALSLIVQNLANRTPGLTPLIWLQSLLPGIIGFILLARSGDNLGFSFRRSGNRPS
ncbi:LPS export ABC transporter permease LptF [Neokomagataea thailandica]|uniref:Transporter YjgP/YjgQ n=1 Tax=Neokomagataea tanensis NBRC 106556 TaxID=1223519 RepID=A0ABQ0QHE9_9PROT|nr:MULTISPECIES: LPS export ABC transporter permease LptF [Neokomagataea]GBR44850.1 transporter YjgP/YjgQ [Neokomagataea tanensis NBRC 106556]